MGAAWSVFLRMFLLAMPAAAGQCKRHNLDFILMKGDALSAEVEDDIRVDLAKVGLNVTARLLEKADFNAAMASGDFNMCFTESWGPPYDPHSFAAGWGRPNNEAHYPALGNLAPPMTNASLLGMIRGVMAAQGEQQRADQWREILLAVHAQSVDLPLWSKRMPAIVSRRLSGYEAGAQQWDYPMHTLQVVSGPKTVTVAPGAQTGLFQSTGRMDPHSYRPNEVFINNWVYEGLVSYGPGGTIRPSLATSWAVEDLPSGGQRYTFRLRAGVRFHDGTAWDCSAAKLNFDHVLAPPLHTLNWHGWYHLPAAVSSWGCTSDGEFAVSLSEKYYPFLQELTLIRPLRMLSPAMFMSGPSTSPVTQNSCPTAWGAPREGERWVQCAGTRGVSGTGRWVLNETKLRSDKSIDEVLLTRNDAHWAPLAGVEALRVRSFGSAAEVKSALLDASLDMVVGAGVLKPSDIAEFRTQRASTFQTLLGPLLMNTLVVLNSQKPPTSDIKVRRVIMHAVKKASIVDKELFGLEEVADSLFPKDAPYCDVDLTPRWDYDFEKATLLNCPDEVGMSPAKKANLGIILGLSLGLGVPVFLGVSGFLFVVGKRLGGRAALAKFKRENPWIALSDASARAPPKESSDAGAGVEASTIGHQL